MPSFVGPLMAVPWSPLAWLTAFFFFFFFESCLLMTLGFFQKPNSLQRTPITVHFLCREE